MTEQAPDVVLDARGIHCPMPVLKTKKALDGINAGQILKVMATDPGAKADIPAFLGRVGHELIEAREEDGTFIFFIRKK